MITYYTGKDLRKDYINTRIYNAPRSSSGFTLEIFQSSFSEDQSQKIVHTIIHSFYKHIVFQSLSCDQLCDPMDCITPVFPVPHQLLELAQTPVH